MQAEMLEAIAPSGVGLRVQFVWRGDRFGHFVSLINASGNVIELLESMEGDARDPWPPSPPLQSLNLHSLPDGRRAALLVGMAGRSHWSASIETTADRAAIVFDIACRTTAEAPTLQSAYRRGANSTPAKLSDGSVQIACEAGMLRIAVERDAELFPGGDEVMVIPNCQLRSPTRRWTYRIEFGSPVDFDQT